MRGGALLQRWRSQLGKESSKQTSRFFTSVTLQHKPVEDEATTFLELWTWGRGEVGQLGLGKESTERSPSLLVSLPQKFRLASMPGILESPSSPNGVEEVGMSCGLFHSCFWKNGQLWLWGKGDGGRLGSGSEVSLYNPHLNPFLTNVKSAALGGLHSAAITAEGEVYTL